MPATKKTSDFVSSAVDPSVTEMEAVPKYVPLLGSHLKMAYYFRLIPFKLKYDIGQKRWTLSSSKLNIVSCVLLTWIPCILRAALNIVIETDLFVEFSDHSAKSYFEITCFYLNLLGSLYIFRIIASRKGEMESAINGLSKILEIHQDSCHSVWRSEGTAGRRMNTAVKRAQAYFIIVGVVYYTLMLVMIATSIIFPSETLFYERENLFARQFLLFSDPDNSTADTYKGKLSASDFFGTIMYTWILDSLQLVGFIPEFFLMVPYPLALWLAVKKFEILLYERSDAEQGKVRTAKEEVADIGERYEQLKELSNSLNSAWGKVNFIWHLSTLNLIIFGLTYLNQGDWSLSRSLALLIMIMRLVCYAVAAKFSADVFVKMENIRQWLTSPNGWSKFWLSETRPQIKRIYMDLGNGPVGISYDGMYQCTYGFIAMVLTFVVTIFTVTFEKPES